MDHAKFFAAVRSSLFGNRLSQQAVDGIGALLAAFDKYGDGDRQKLAYILGTAFHETDRFSTLEEYASGEAYEGRQSLGNTQPGDGKRFKGRGFVQVTGRRNYTDWSKRLSVDLVANPELAEQPSIAARICVDGMMKGTFTGRKLSQYINADTADFTGARRIVNGTDKAETIAGYGWKFNDALKASGYGAEIVSDKPGAELTPAPALASLPPILATVPEVAPDPIAAISKAVGAAKGGAIGAVLSTGGMTSVSGLLSAANWLPTLSTTQMLVIFGGLTAVVAVVLCAGFAFWRAYQAPPNKA